MKKSLSVFGLAVLLLLSLFVFSSCGESRKVSDKQLVNDLSVNETIATIFKSELFETEPFEYFSHNITKRQTNPEKKEDIIYCNLTVSNKNFSVNADCVLNYNYYDEGGWILDDVEVSNRKVSPTNTFSNEEIMNVFKKASTQSVISNILEEHGQAGITVLKSEIVSENNSYIMRIHLNYKRSLSVLEGYVELPFENEKGWHWESTSINPTKLIEADYKKAIGTFNFDAFLYNFNLYVDSIDTKEGYAEIRLQRTGSFGFWYKDGAVMKCPFNVYEGIIDVSAEELHLSSFGGIQGSFTYNASTNNWY